ncbi:hypothetical protein GCK72_006141 [Caenorhabditis remanei]|uniref:Uncharacterized protein n=1 Tax=Caenorhabditis remanei TaxID=31234 RepID=A0A6A5HFJ0_CAERE|nr:hypothetical protein GCK72_006141 [Caenorhabditis remanei]KAF1766185.1 hypothetical protein GCK72_006141 [Caenorhabditis remanei]
MVGASLLQSDDDSDVPDLDLRGAVSNSSRRRTFFNKSTTDYEEIRHRQKTYKTIFLISFLFIFIVALYFLYTAMCRVKLLSEEIEELRQKMGNVEDFQIELKTIRIQFEVIRENEIENEERNGTVRTGSTTGMIYDKLANISSRFDLLWDGFQKNSMSMDDVTSRMSRVENKCLAVCQQHDSVGGVAMPRGREQPRRRQAAGKVKTAGGADEIVFRRND